MVPIEPISFQGKFGELYHVTVKKSKGQKKVCYLLTIYIPICGYVHGKGHFRYKGHEYYLGDAFGGENIALRDSAKPGRIAIEYREFRIGRINVDEQKLENRRAWLLRDDPRSK